MDKYGGLIKTLCWDRMKQERRVELSTKSCKVEQLFRKYMTNMECLTALANRNANIDIMFVI